MQGYYETREYVKGLLKKCGLLDLAATLYHSRWALRKIKNCFWLKKREKGYLDPKFDALKKYENIHEGERCFIICTGPSLRVEDVEKLKNEYTFSMNSIIKLYPQTDWRPTYYAIEDIDVYMKLENDLKQCQPNPIFISDWLAERVKPKFYTISYPYDIINHYPVGNYRLPRFCFSGNAYTVVYDGYTTTFTIIQLAVYMGFKEIYLLGCDCNYNGDKKHFINYESSNRSRPYDIHEKMLAAYKKAKEYSDAHEIKIYNATRGGKLEVFERVDFDELFHNRTKRSGTNESV